MSDEKNIQHIAKSHGLKNRRASLRMSEWDFTRIHYKYLTGKFQDSQKKIIVGISNEMHDLL